MLCIISLAKILLPQDVQLLRRTENTNALLFKKINDAERQRELRAYNSQVNPVFMAKLLRAEISAGL